MLSKVLKAPFKLLDGSLRIRIAALLLATSLAPLMLSAYIDIRQTRTILLKGVQDLLQARGDQVARESDTFNRGFLRSANRITRLPQVADFCSRGAAGRAEALPKVVGLLSAFASGNANITRAGLLDGAGKVIASTSPGMDGQELAAYAHVRTALAGAPVVSDIHVETSSAGELPVIAYLAPMQGQDRPTSCVAVLWVRAQALWNILKASNGLAGSGSFAVLFDQQGIRVAHTYRDDVVFHPGGRLDAASVETLVEQRRFGARTRALLQDVWPCPEQFARARAGSPDHGVFHGLSPGNQAWSYGVARRFETAPWTLFYMVPEAGVAAQIATKEHEKIALAAGIAALACGTGLFFAAGILRPIRSLSDATSAIAGGDMAARARSRRRDEIGQLVDRFDDMADRIQDHALALERARSEQERRVEERTVDLSRATERLREETAERERTEDAAHESQELLRAIIDNTTAVVYVKDLQGRYLLVNRRYTDIFRLTVDGVVGRTDDDLFPAAAAAAFRDMDRRVAQAQAPLIEEEAVPQHDGPHTYVSVKCPLRDRHGVVRGIFGISTDITERKRAESKLQAQLEKLNLLDQITCAIGEWQDLQSIYQVVISHLEERLPLDFCCVCRHDPLENALTVTRVGARSEALAPGMAMGERASVPVDVDGLSRCLQGHLMHEPDTEESASPFPQRLARGGLRSLVVAPLRSESRVFGVLVCARRQPDSFDGGEREFLRQLSAHVALAARQAGLHGSLQRAYDDLRQTQQAAMRQERLRALGQMASGIAHDINNAILPVMIYTELLLEREPGLSAQARGHLENIERSVDDVAETVTRLREFYRPREPQPMLEPVALSHLVRQVVELTRARWSDMPQRLGIVVRLETELAPDLPVVMGVESEIREALINLVFNAVDAMPDGGTLALRTHLMPSTQEHDAATPCIQVEVADTGVGMSEDTRRQCFDPFFTTKGERGTGLGLAMVYGTTQRHGAEIDMQSKAGQGTTVTWRFPVPAAADAGIPVRDEPDERPRPMRILVVDDDPLLLQPLQAALEADGHTVVTADSGQAGIDVFCSAHARRPPFDAVITDLGMPYVDGRKVASAVKRASPRTPVILLTGWGQQLIDDGDIPEPVDQVLSKPPKLAHLRQALLRCCRQAPLEAAA